MSERLRRTQSLIPRLSDASLGTDAPSNDALRPSNRSFNKSLCRNLSDVARATIKSTRSKGLDTARAALLHTTGSIIQHHADNCEGLESLVLKSSLVQADNGTVPSELMVSQGNQIESVDIGGDQIFAKHAELIQTARREVCIQTFAWQPTCPSVRMILDSLLVAAENHRKSEKASGGDKLRVCLLINEYLGPAKKFMLMTSATNPQRIRGRWPSTPHALMGNFKNDPQHPYASLLRDIDFQVRVHQHMSSNSLHSKSVVVDGQAAAVTGASMQARNHGDHPAYDCGITFRGEGAQGLREDFVYHWNNASNPDQPTEPLPKTPLPSATKTEAPERKSGVKMAVVTRKPDGNILNTGNNNPQNRAFLAAVANARDSIQILTPNLNSPWLLRALSRAADRGVHVQILLSKGFNDARMNNLLAGGTNAKTIDRLKSMVKNRSAIDIRYFRNPASDKNSPVPEGNTLGWNHAKYFSADGEIVIVGSANMDRTSWYFSAETNLALFGTEAVQRIKSTVFDPAFDHSEPVPINDARVILNPDPV